MSEPEDCGPFCIECGRHLNGGKPHMGATLGDCAYCRQRAATGTVSRKEEPSE